MIDGISEEAQNQVIEGLMQVYKFQHTIQIIRWLGQAHSNYNLDAWESVSKALHFRMDLEGMLSMKMTGYKVLEKEMQIIIALSNSKNNLKKLADLDAICKKNKSDFYNLQKFANPEEEQGESLALTMKNIIEKAKKEKLLASGKDDKKGSKKVKARKNSQDSQISVEPEELLND